MVSSDYCKKLITYSLAIKKNKVLMHASTWINLRAMMLSERSQMQKPTCCLIPLIRNVHGGKIYRDRKSIRVYLEWKEGWKRDGRGPRMTMMILLGGMKMFKTCNEVMAAQMCKYTCEKSLTSTLKTDGCRGMRLNAVRNLFVKYNQP